MFDYEAVLDPTEEIKKYKVCAHVTAKPTQKTLNSHTCGFKEFQLAILFYHHSYA